GRPASAPPPWMDARGLALPSPSAAPLPELAAPPLMPGRAPMAAAPVAATAPELIFPHLELSAPPRETTGTLATTIRLVAETSDDLRGFVERGLNEVNERVKRLARSDSAPPSAGRADDAAARQLLGRVRAIMEEERFRSGRLR
ncbi:MAG TPA: hypothetical protein VN806_01945, partial [Caulobacteraceae bacterium]|nr:hypothetical protein [Caulobacteraceae bacterium]